MQDVSSAPARGSGRKKGGRRVVLFVALFTTRGGGTFQEGTARRLQWQVPVGVDVFAGRIGRASGGAIVELSVVAGAFKRKLLQHAPTHTGNVDDDAEVAVS